MFCHNVNLQNWEHRTGTLVSHHITYLWTVTVSQHNFHNPNFHGLTGIKVLTCTSASGPGYYCAGTDENHKHTACYSCSNRTKCKN